MFQYLPILLPGTLVTLQIASLSFVLALVFAFIAAFGRMSQRRVLRWPATAYIEFFRGTSLLVQLFWLFFVLPQFGILLPAMAVGVLGIALNYGAYGAEVVRGAISGVPRGQHEAAAALGLKPRQTMWKVIVPQAAVIMIPPWGNLLIQLLKATSLVSLITITDVTFRAYQLNQLTMRTAEIFGSVLLIYFCLAHLAIFGTRFLERRFSRGRLQGAWR
jgi:polar amino acid transport system permease protein